MEKAQETSTAHLSDMNDFLAAKRGHKDRAIRIQKSKFLTKMARLLTTSESITALMYLKELSIVSNLKAEPLQKYLMDELKFPQTQLMRSEKRWKTMLELVKLVENYYTSKWDEKENIMAEYIKAMLAPPPPGFMPFLSSPSASSSSVSSSSASSPSAFSPSASSPSASPPAAVPSPPPVPSPPVVLSPPAVSSLPPPPVPLHQQVPVEHFLADDCSDEKLEKFSGENFLMVVDEFQKMDFQLL